MTAAKAVGRARDHWSLSGDPFAGHVHRVVDHLCLQLLDLPCATTHLGENTFKADVSPDWFYNNMQLSLA